MFEPFWTHEFYQISGSYNSIEIILLKMANIMFVAPKPKSLLGYHRQLAPSAAVKVSPLCLGTMGFGTQLEELMGRCDRNTSFEILDFFYESGGNFIDTYVIQLHGCLYDAADTLQS